MPPHNQGVLLCLSVHCTRFHVGRTKKSQEKVTFLLVLILSFEGPCEIMRVRSTLSTPPLSLFWSIKMPKRKKAKNGRGTWISAKKRLAIYFRDAWTCAYCKCSINLANHSLDHLTPWSTGIRDNRAFNLVTSCRDCNNLKGDSLTFSPPPTTKKELPDVSCLFIGKTSKKQQYDVLRAFLE